MQYCLL